MNIVKNLKASKCIEITNRIKETVNVLKWSRIKKATCKIRLQNKLFKSIENNFYNHVEENK